MISSFVSDFIHIYLTAIKEHLTELKLSHETFEAGQKTLEASVCQVNASRRQVIHSFQQLKNAILEPSIFFRLMLEQDSSFCPSMDILSFLATVFDWNSDCNFTQLVQDGDFRGYFS